MAITTNSILKKAKGISANRNAGDQTPHKITMRKRIWKSRYYYLMLLPAILWLTLFEFAPLYGIQIAFKNFKMSLGITESSWVGLYHFQSFVKSYSFKTLITNTFALSFYTLFVGFPIPILVALILNETKGRYKRLVQTTLYAPHFISVVVLVGMLDTMLSPSFGVVNYILEGLGMERVYFMAEPGMFRHLYVWSGVWQGMGWGAIVYLAALSAVDPALHEAAELDGASRLQRIIHVNLPTILPTIITMLILRVGNIATVGYEKVYLMMNDLNVSTAEVISTYVYKRGLQNANYSFAAAVGLLNNVVNITMVLIANRISKKVSDTSLF